MDNQKKFFVVLFVAIVSCPILPNVLQSSRIPTTPSNTYNEMVTYTCNVGYEQTSGDLTRTCQADKTWTGTTPTCTIVSCPSLPNVLQSSRIPTTPSNTYDEMVTYTCNVGYEQTSGDLTRTCQADKTWTGTTPTCNIITCGDLPNVPHSSTSPTTPSTTFESAVTYSCLSGYEHSSGTLQRQCQADKQWSGVKPVCDPVNCGTLPTVPFTSNTKTGTHYLDTITYTCSPGYVHINGSLSRKCQSDRVWDGIPPYCASTPSTPDALSNMYITVGVAGGILLLIPLVIICLLCNLKDKICPKANMKGKDIGPKERFNGSKRKGPNDYYSDYSSSRQSFRQPSKVHYPVYNPGYY